VKDDLPLVPTTIKSTLYSSAYRTIASATDVSVTITSVLITSPVLSLILLNHCSAPFLAAPKICFTELGIVSSPNLMNSCILVVKTVHVKQSVEHYFF
jgi:hypothetical protein